jgi:hypothetical protein
VGQDHVRLSEIAEDQSALHLHNACRRQRYSVNPAHAAMLQVFLGMGSRPVTGEGFELAAADFCAFAAVFARGIASKKYPAFDYNTYPELEFVAGAWQPPLAFVSFLGQIGDYNDGPQCSPAFEVKIVESCDRIDDTMDVTALQMLNTGGKVRNYFVINAPRASYADLIGIIDSRIAVVMQCKRCPSSPLTERGVFEELHKMGLRSDACLWARAVGAMQELPRTQRLAAYAAFLGKLPPGAQAEARPCLFDDKANAKGISERG